MSKIVLVTSPALGHLHTASEIHFSSIPAQHIQHCRKVFGIPASNPSGQEWLLLRKGRALPSFKGRTFLVVDDGIATGTTLYATLKLCRSQHPKKLIVAAPIAGKEASRHLEKLVDEVLVLKQPGDFRAISHGYHHFTNHTDEQTLEFINKHQMERNKNT